MNFVHYLDTNILDIKEKQATKEKGTWQAFWKRLIRFFN